MNKKEYNHHFELTGAQAIGILAFLLIPWCVGMLDIFMFMWNIVLK